MAKKSTKTKLALGDAVHFWCERHDRFAPEEWLHQVLDGTYTVAERRAAILADRLPKKG